jgi:polyhydroxyalkanoate synthesis regulator phasin
MDQKDALKQMIQYNKTVFENTFSSLTMVQDQMEKTMDMFMKQSTWFPEEGKKVVDEYSKAYKKARENFKNAVDESFKKLEGFFGGAA